MPSHLDLSQPELSDLRSWEEPSPDAYLATRRVLERGLDVNYREKGDNTYAMHWAAAQGNFAIVRKLADAGGDVIGDGDDHAMGVIGWASCWSPRTVG